MKLFCNTCEKIFSPAPEVSEGMVHCPHCNKEIPMPASKTSPGSVINDFIIEKFISKGGMGEVFEARQISLDRPVALKVIQEKFVNDKEYVDSLIHEARAAAKINHPNIVQAYSVGEDEGVYFFAMELVRGETFKEILKREKVIEPTKAAKVIADIASALAVAWKEQKLVHQDIKPDNIMLDANNFAKLADLGLARKAENLEDSTDDSDEVMGTPQYISPEQLLGIRTDIRSDIYSLGATFFHFVTGRFAYVADTADEITRMHVAGNLEEPKKFNPDLPDELNAIIVKMMARNIEERYQSAEELIDDIKAYLRSVDLPTTTGPVKVPSNSIKITKPTIPGAKPLPGIKPVLPGVKPVTPGAKVATPGIKPAVPGVKPVLPGAKPAVPGVKPVLPGAKPAVPGVKPATPVSKPVNPGAKVATPVVKPAAPAAQVVTPEAKVATPAEAVSTPQGADNATLGQDTLEMKSPVAPVVTPTETTTEAPKETTQPESAKQPEKTEEVSIANSSQKEKALSKADEAAKAAAIAKKKESIQKTKKVIIKIIATCVSLIILALVLSVGLYFLTKFEKLPAKVKPYGEKFNAYVNKKLGLEKKEEGKVDDKNAEKSENKVEEKVEIKLVTRPEFINAIEKVISINRSNPDNPQMILAEADKFLASNPVPQTEEEKNALNKLFSLLAYLDESVLLSPYREKMHAANLAKIEKAAKILEAERIAKLKEIEAEKKRQQEQYAREAEIRKQEEALKQEIIKRTNELRISTNNAAYKFAKEYKASVINGHKDELENAISDASSLNIPFNCDSPTERVIIANYNSLYREMPKHYNHMRAFITKIADISNEGIITQTQYNNRRMMIKLSGIDENFVLHFTDISGLIKGQINLLKDVALATRVAVLIGKAINEPNALFYYGLLTGNFTPQIQKVAPKWFNKAWIPFFK